MRYRSTGGSIKTAKLRTPLGPMLAGATERGVCFLEFLGGRRFEIQARRLCAALGAELVPGWNRHIDELNKQLAEYFAGRRTRFDLPLVLAGTPFQRKAWRALLAIPYGSTRSYGEQAARMGRPAAVRAVARANGANRISIVIPCHRVIGADGALTGYGGGLRRKRRLLDLESGGKPAGLAAMRPTPRPAHRTDARDGRN
jgi:AraC family transcriptional regulator of adaptative response/methylated-DNA-[protein]-cysteine methyltransferase